MLRLIYAVFLSFTVLQTLNCDIIEKINETLNKNQNFDKLPQSGNDNIVDLSNSDYVQSSEVHQTINFNNTVISNNDNLSIINSTLDMSNNSSNSTSSHTTKTTIDDERFHEIEISIKANQTDQTEPLSPKADDILTFAKYRERIEKESKQKREKSDSIPNSPTSIINDKQVVRGTVDQITSQTQRDHQESLSSVSSLNIQKDDTDNGHNSRKSDDLKVELSSSILLKNSMKNNVAAKECGAKILEISGKITHASFVLNNNKDEYLNVPCMVPDKWFVVETCEPVQIRSIQIGNFEMFSSRPKTFKVATADRYPVKYWHHLGMFRAHDEKGLQTFEVSDTRMVKYLKFEMIDHYGNEHYCPLTFVRVMGNIVIDDMDDDNDEDQPTNGEKNDSPKEVPSKIQTNGLLSSAKNMIAKIVHGIGGSQRKDILTINQNTIEVSSDHDSANVDSSATESPCYFLEFLMKYYRNYFQNILVHFLRLKYLESDLNKELTKGIVYTIFDQPFPAQIRVEYFTLLDLITKTEYSFLGLYQSFVNISSYCSDDCFAKSSLHELRKVFSCHSSHSRLYREYQTILPNLNEIPSDNVLIQGVVEEIFENKSNNSDISSRGPEPALPDYFPDAYLSNFVDSIKMEDNFSELQQEVKMNVPESIGTAQAKYKSEDNLDSKSFSNPGNNAWNFAFMRIKNIAKELEVNVSISMTYLEEFSQNYKQQTDKLKKAQLVMAENVTQLENMINQHRQETRLYVKELKIQLKAIIVRLRLGMNSETERKMNLSTMERYDDDDCIDLLAESLILPSGSLFDSPIFVTVLSVCLSLLCNSILLALVFKKIRNSILNDITKTVVSSKNARLICEPVNKELIIPNKAASLDDLKAEKPTFPIVLPPRGVYIPNFPDSDFLSDDGNLPRRHKGFGPLFYPVQPSVNFVTPTKDKKSKRRK